MISEKMIRLAGNSSAIRAMFEEGNRLAALYGRENVYDFSLGNPNFPAPPSVKQAALDILQNTDPVYLHGYMSNAGYPEAREAIAASLNRRFGTSFSAANVIMTVGAAGSLNIVLKTLLNPGDEVIAIAPYFVEYGNYVNNYDGVLKVVRAREDFQIDPEAVAAAVTEKTKAVIINTPNNPTGVIYSAETLRALGEALERKQEEFGTSIWVISDEPYRELAYDGAEVPWVTGIIRNSIVCYSWSKSLSLPGERIGYAVVPAECDESELILTALAIANRVSGCVNAPSLFQLVAARCADETTDLSGYDTNRRLLYDGLTDAGFECVFPQGAFYIWMKTPEEDDRAFAERAKKYNILVVPGASFAWPGYVRLAYCVARQTIERSMPGFRKLAQEYGRNGK
ncbi:MAG: pyridoxal phosphate-dependent aminotransferase [Oscillospiraceae bacterium]|nr:pyridoxal phosphate-dependent aminotransferase [Oscillospiraceae bacterium]